MDSSSWGLNELLIQLLPGKVTMSRSLDLQDRRNTVRVLIQRQEKKRHHDVAYAQLELNLSFGTSTPRTYNERYYYVQDSTSYEQNSANAACITVKLLRLSRSAKQLAFWTARSMRGADMNSALNTLARKQNNIDRRLQSLRISKLNVLSVTFILTPVRLGAGLILRWQGRGGRMIRKGVRWEFLHGIGH
ncbi:uncharacterized protein EAE98_008854 [Botrytis deweyae]|uniref:Uncharacterized protein n=1 Tax=Botrytis deweyae TaxID=2478750 RepID=A0ABQ7ID99_9HELO|nr:uncharacterized protein EAE98_008854 [Botrytis deweyae]KAF7920825.1 hypothetical protein EAE98_008854 [Botrytis deweyae]